MDLALHGFDAKPPPPIKVVVGPQKVVLYAPRTLLVQIPYSAEAEAMVNDTAVETGFRLPDLDPTTVADLFHFVSADDVTDLVAATRHMSEHQARIIATRYIKAYVTAHEWRLTWLLKPIRKQLVVFHQFAIVNPDDAYELYDADLEETVLYRFWIAELGYDICYNWSDRVKGEVNFWDHYHDIPARILWDLVHRVSDRASRCPSCQNCQECTTFKQPAQKDEWLMDDSME